MEQLRYVMFQESALWALHEFDKDGDILALSGVGSVDVWRQLVESLLEGLEALRDMFVDEEES